MEEIKNKILPASILNESAGSVMVIGLTEKCETGVWITFEFLIFSYAQNKDTFIQILVMIYKVWQTLYSLYDLAFKPF